ncbi:hypothetical protein FACS1894152_8110 [Bacilli bacterium]|nr:hypothetical protein FACS1894152_8110 [Bacilli bacterium]
MKVLAGLLDFDEKTKTFSIYSKGRGCDGGLSTRQTLKLKNGKFVLIQQQGTKDLRDRNYELTQEEDDWWYIQYENNEESVETAK